jgi:hypothetical protein
VSTYSDFIEHVYKDGGDDYFSLPMRVIAELDPFDRTAVLEVGAALMILARRGNLHPTSREIAELLPSDRGKKKDGGKEEGKDDPPGHRCISFVQKGLRKLGPSVVDEDGNLVLDEDGEPVFEGLGLLDRLRRHGKRFLTWVKGLKPSPWAKAKDKDKAGGKGGSAAAPLSTPPPDPERRDTTTEGPSSSSPGPAPPGADGLRERPPAEVVDRACRLIPEATPDWVGAMVAVYGSDWFSRALDRAEEVNRTPGRKKVYRRRFIHRTLENWREEGGPPRRPDPPPAASARPAVVAPKEETPRPLTAEDVANLVGGCAGLGKFAEVCRKHLREHLRAGLIPPDLVVAIPPHLRE